MKHLTGFVCLYRRLFVYKHSHNQKERRVKLTATFPFCCDRMLWSFSGAHLMQCVKHAVINHWSFTNRWWRSPDRHRSAKTPVGSLFLEKPFYLKLWEVNGGSPSATWEISFFFSLMSNRLSHVRLLLFTIGCQETFFFLVLSLGIFKVSYK